MARALIVDDDPGSLEPLGDLVRQSGFDTRTALNLAEARAHLAEEPADVVLTDLFLPDGSGIDLLEEHDGAAMEIVVITGNASIDSAVAAMRAGARDYLVKPIDVPRLRSILAHVQRTLDLEGEIQRLRGDLRDLGRFGSLVGASAPMQRVYEIIAKVAPTNATVLITGESGTGKDLLAQTIHVMSRRRKEPFVPVNCGAISPSLIESELFGHERGSFTGAERLHRGYFERASAGTLFLDEITEMPYELQVKLLRVLETSTLQRVGGEGTVEVDVRIVAATNQNPEEAVAEGKLRSDLLYRLRVFSVTLPPLRERDADIALLARHFLEILNREAGTRKDLAPAVLERLSAHSWPGNVRELKNVVEHAFILAGRTITGDCLPEDIVGADPVSALPPDAGVTEDRRFVRVGVGTSLAEAERTIILSTLDAFAGDKKRTARALGVSLKTLYNRLNAYSRR
jgi:two-component system response regulator AtoC